MGSIKKFRAWNPMKEKFWDGNGQPIAVGGGKVVDGGDWQGWYYNQECDYIVEQYTGLKDRNGKEIYEGDIVNIRGIACTNDSEMACIIDTNCVVLWDKRYARFDVKDKPESKDWDYRRRRYFLFTDKDRDDVEVIGNIHENPELLGGGE